MIKRYGLVSLATLLLSFHGLPGDAVAGGPAASQELVQEIEMLKTIVMDLNERLATAEATLQLSLEQQNKQGGQGQELQDELDELDKRVSGTEEHSTLDKLNLSADLETKLNSLHIDAKGMPLPLQNGIMSMANGIPFTKAALAAFGPLPSPEDQNIDNNTIFDTRIRVDMKARPADSLSFVGRLSANKVFGDSTGVKWYNGGPNSIAMDGNVHSTGSDSAIRLERAFVTYFDDIGTVPYHFSVGRRPALGGGPEEFSTASTVGGSPMAHGINWQFDGISLGFNLAETTGIEGSAFKICWGNGFESGAGSGNSYSFSSSSDVDDMQFAGWIANLYENDKTKIINMYAHAFDVTDGFTGLVVMPFTMSGTDINGDGLYDSYSMAANTGGYISRTEPTSNIGDLDIVTLLGQSEYKDIGFFVDMALSHARPSGISMSPMMQFFGTDGLLNSNGEQFDRTGYSVWAGLKAPVSWTEGTIGLEYNWGSQYWLGFTGGEDNIAGSKLATRGSVYEIFYNQPFVDNKLVLSVGAQYYDYEYSGSGSPMGDPVKISDLTSLDAFMPVVDTMWNYYVNLAYRW
ncbi:MAG: DUF3373 family protein [Proteobacteria bacterium]|nr:DUF3373 family protein [Pseudomonadota bacterium]MBU1648903.1 DUF3373 family protein [Pseudomonadota bacterium]MBU1986970.1 DUF3373 family protein [Pseudomonadota bacterium]